LYPNVDFYTGLIYKAMGFPTKMFTVLFALGRLPHWAPSGPPTGTGRAVLGAGRNQMAAPRGQPAPGIVG
jgi:hypothetical protein